MLIKINILLRNWKAELIEISKAPVNEFLVPLINFEPIFFLTEPKLPHDSVSRKEPSEECLWPVSRRVDTRKNFPIIQSSRCARSAAMHRADSPADSEIIPDDLGECIADSEGEERRTKQWETES